MHPIFLLDKWVFSLIFVTIFLFPGLMKILLLTFYFFQRNLKEMVELGLSAKQIKADRFQQIKKEVTEMIKARIMHSRTKVIFHF